MKTLTNLLTLLALTIQVTVSGQTQGNQVHKVRIDIMGEKKPVPMNYTNSNITMSIIEYNQLIEQTRQLKIEAQKLRENAEEAENNYLIKQIETSQLSAQITLHKFEENKKNILGFFTKLPKTSIIYNRVILASSESERFMKLAKEMREEAAAQLTLQAKIGSMSNAEEKETLALNKQKEILNMIENSISKEESMKSSVAKNGVENTSLNQNQQNEILERKSEELSGLLFDALKQADNMKTTAQQLREVAVNSSVNEKSVLINEAINLEKEYIAKRLEISNLNAMLTYEKFNRNRLMINTLINTVKMNNETLDYVNQLNIEAERLMKIGKEMREEANAQLTIFAKYGSMSNAEEKELLAIGKQHESIQFIEKNNSAMVIASK